MQMYIWSFVAMIVIIIGFIVAWMKNKKWPVSDKKTGVFTINGFYPIMDLTKFWSLVIFFTMVGLTIGLAYTGNNPFIYGKF
jgi:hypothetical protein